MVNPTLRLWAARKTAFMDRYGGWISALKTATMVILGIIALLIALGAMMAMIDKQNARFRAPVTEEMLMKVYSSSPHLKACINRRIKERDVTKIYRYEDLAVDNTKCAEEYRNGVPIEIKAEQDALFNRILEK